jgi:hypothetical protein
MHTSALKFDTRTRCCQLHLPPLLDTPRRGSINACPYDFAFRCLFLHLSGKKRVVRCITRYGSCKLAVV